MKTISSQPVGALHTAYLDPTTGVGMLVRPPPTDDVRIGPHSIHGADWNAALRKLNRLGWSLLIGDDDLPVIEGTSLEGGEVVSLYGHEPTAVRPSFEEIRISVEALRLAALNS